MIETPITVVRTQEDVPLTIDQGNAKVRIGLRDCVSRCHGDQDEWVSNSIVDDDLSEVGCISGVCLVVDVQACNQALCPSARCCY